MKKTILIFSFILFYVLLLSYKVYSDVVYSVYGDAQFYLNQNDSIGFEQEINKFVEIELLSATPINASCFVAMWSESGLFSFTSNTNGTLNITKSIDEVTVQINDVAYSSVPNGYHAVFNSGDLVKISWRIVNTTINAIIGIIGIGLFCANPVLSYKLSKGDKIKFMFFVLAIGIVSIGLAFTFIYG